jgi:integrase
LDHLASCRARGLSPKTIRDNYGYALKSVFLPWAADEGITEPEQITNRVLDRFTAHLLEHGGKARPAQPPLRRVVRGVRQWCSAGCRRSGELKAKAAAQVPRRPERVLDVLSREEIQLEDAAKTERDKLIIRLLADTGIRVGELLGLRCSDLMERDRNHYLRVAGPSQGGGAKGDRSRLAPVPRIWRRLQRYIERGRPKDTNSDRIFLAVRRDRRTGDYEPLTKSGVEQADVCAFDAGRRSRADGEAAGRGLTTGRAVTDVS